VLAFFIYWIFNPSGAARLWYNVRTFPQRMAGWMWSTKEFLDYDSYKSKISSIWDSIWDKVESLGDGIENLGDKIDVDIEDKSDENDKIEKESNEKNIEKDEVEASDKDWKTIRSFAKNTSLNFIDMKSLEVETSNQEDENILTWYSKSDLFWIINTYLEKNLDDDTDILVTVEYEDDSNDPQKIILQTQPK
jgi:hypothetical protein